jgi:uncharacterized repeat protein (TIGR03803 family)
MESFARFTLTLGALALVAGCGGGAQSSIGPPATNAQVVTGPRHQSPAAVSYDVLHRFSLDGRAAPADPDAGLLDVNGTLYGTTSGKGEGKQACGTVFSLTTTGVSRTIYRFHGPDGCNPSSTLIDVNGALYGTTMDGGETGYGTVFSLTTSGVETVLHSFSGAPDGANPYSGLVNLNGTLYGTTFYGGTISGNCPDSFADIGCGIVYSITTSGAESILYEFKGEPDGMQPTAPLIAVNGKLYGTTTQGGLYSGTVFSITTAGAESVLYSFKGGSDGSWPFAPLIHVNGTFYGTTDNSGSSNNGTVYSVTASGSESVLYRFAGGSDGQNPTGGLIDVDGTLYGTTFAGGDAGCKNGSYSGCGTVYSVTPSGSEKVLHRFQSGSDGARPNAGLLSLSGTFYGTTLTGGGKGCHGAGCGTVFSITP